MIYETEKNIPNLVQSLIICEKSPLFPYNSLNTPNHPNFLKQKEIIKICYDNLNVNPAKYKGRKIVPVGEIKDAKQIHEVSWRLFSLSRDVFNKLSYEEQTLLGNICKLKNWKELEIEGLEERVAIMMEGCGMNSEKVSTRFVDRVYWEIENTKNLEKYLPLG